MENNQLIPSSSSKPTTSDDTKNDIQMVLAKMMEEKHTYTYKKLVVPMSMRSIYWKFFGFPATEEGDILTKVKIVCIICKTQIAYNRNTSNLRMHLQNKHAQELHELETVNPPRRQILSQETKEHRAQKRMLKAGVNATHHIYTTNADGTVQIGGDLKFVTDPNINLSSVNDDLSIGQPLRVMIKNGTTVGHSSPNMTFLMPDENSISRSGTDDRTVSDAITEFIIMDLQLPEVVEGQGFQRLIATLRSPCEIPSKQKLEDEIIPKVYDSFRESVATNLSCIESEIGLAIEEWKSKSNECFVTFSVYFQNIDEASLDYKVLSTLHAPIEWGEIQWGTAVDSLLLDWDIRIERITAVVIGTSRTELLDALISRGLAIVPCLLHTLQVCAQACFDTPEVVNILSKCRAAIGAIASHPAASTSLAMQEQLLEFDEYPMVMDYPTIWTSTYNMLEQIILRRNIIDNILESMEGIDQEVIDLSNEQWKIIEDLVSVLEPFKVTIMTLSEEKIPLISLLKPLLWQLVSSHLKVKEDDNDIARSFKESLSEMLCDRYADNNITLLLQIATTLDPRFKQLPYATEEHKSMVAAPIKEMLVKLIEDEGEDRMMVEPVGKKSRLSGMELLLGDLCTLRSEIPADEKANLEFIQYQSEATAPLDCCPLQWWAKMSAKCPNLGKLARRYNCVPACCSPPNHIPPDAQVIHDVRRAALPPHLTDKLLFLHGNHNV